MKPESKSKPRKRKHLTSVLGLTLDGNRLEGVVLKRNNGSLAVLQSFSVQLSLDPLTAQADLVGREIRNHLDAAGVRERECIVGLPLRWVLTLPTELPAMSDADAASLLQMEAERGFHTDTAQLQIDDSRSPLPGDKRLALLAAVPTAHIGALEAVLAAAKLKPASLSLGLTALQPPSASKSDGVIALAVGEGSVGVSVTTGGVSALRALEGVIETEGGRRSLVAGTAARETRVTLGQLPDELRSTIKRIRVFGPSDLANQLAEEMRLKFAPMGLQVEVVTGYAPNEFGVSVPPNTPVSPAFSLAARLLAGQSPVLEFLPPKPTLIEQMITRYSAGRLRTTGAIAVGVAVLLIGLFLYQQVQLWYLRHQWSRMEAKVSDLNHVQSQIQFYRPWHDGTYRTLSILRQLSLAFSENGAVTAKSIEIHDSGYSVSCSGNTTDSAALQSVLAKLSSAPGVSLVKLDQLRGKSPMQFSFNFKYGTGGMQ